MEGEKKEKETVELACGSLSVTPSSLLLGRYLWVSVDGYFLPVPPHFQFLLSSPSQGRHSHLSTCSLNPHILLRFINFVLLISELRGAPVSTPRGGKQPIPLTSRTARVPHRVTDNHRAANKAKPEPAVKRKPRVKHKPSP